MLYFGILGGLWIWFWWPLIVVSAMIDLFYFTSAAHCLLADKVEYNRYREKPGLGTLSFTFVVLLAILHLFGVVDVVTLVMTRSATILLWALGYFATGMILYMPARGLIRAYRYRVVMESKLKAEKTDFVESRREAGLDDTQIQREWDLYKIAFVKENKPVADRHINWMVAIAILWLPDFLYQSVFHFLEFIRDGVEFLIRQCRGIFQWGIDRLAWQNFGKDI